MARGVTETTRGSAHYPKEQSVVVRRNATEQDLELARQHIGKQIKPQLQSANQTPPAYRCVDVRLDSLKRLIFDLEKEDRQPEGRGVRDAAII